MSDDKQPNYIIRNATALYPKIDRTYRYDSGENRSVPCDALDDGAEYSVKFKVDEATAKELFGFMKELYNDRKKSNWPEFKNPLKKEEDGTFSYKASLKGAYNGQKTNKPNQCDAKLKALPDDFQLTTGSTVNIAVVGIPYSAAIGAGVSLRLRGVQVIKLAEKQQRSPFEAVDGFEFDSGNPFAESAPVASTPADDEGFDDVEENSAPKKRPSKKAEAPAEKTALADVVDAWGDD